MEELIKALDEHLECSNIEINDNQVIFHAYSTKTDASCPYCGLKSSSVHTQYLHHFQDLPIQNRNVLIFLNTRRFRCYNPECSHRTFAETFSFVEANAQKTKRLQNEIVTLSLTQSSLSAAKQLNELGIAVKKSSICHYLKKKNTLIDKDAVCEVCIDDFAMKRRFKYGTVMVNVETGKITDLLESRETSEVSKWLTTFPNIRIVSRDGSKAFKKAISEAFPTAIQVTDRFHLISRLIQIITNYLFSLLPSRIAIPISSEREETDEHFFLYASRREKILFVQDLYFKKHLTMQEIRMKTGFSLKTIDKYCSMAEADIPPDTIIQRAREHETTTKAKQKRVTEVLSLKNQGRTVEEIADITGYTRQTINRYLSPNYSPEHANYGVDFPGRLSKYRKKVLQLRQEGKTYKEIYNMIKTEGYDGSVDAIRGFMARQRRIHKDIQEKYCDVPVEIIERKWLIRLLYNPIEEVPVIKPEDLPVILKEYPAYKNSAEVVWEFRHIVSEHQVEGLKKWIIQARSIPFGELDSFLNGIEQDIEAVSYALTHSYSNGLAEGSINKIKTIKQQMYGRCTFALLRNKVLLLEDWHST